MSTYRSLLVPLDAEPLCAARTDVALRLAADFDCHLIGLAPTGLLDFPAAAAASATMGELTALALDALRDQAEQAAERFRDACRRAGLKSFEAIVDEGEQAQSIVRHAVCGDLAVVSQADPAAPGHRQAGDRVERVVLHSARPTLVVPYAGRFERFGERPLVAWDDSREAARAVSDALPLLRRARRTTLVRWNEGGAGEDDAALRLRLEALARWLQRHGVAAEAQLQARTPGLDIADAVLSHAADLDADLIVMGAWGRARLAERLLGGATRGLLASMTVPVVMSH